MRKLNCKINLDALRHNYNLAKTTATYSKVMAAVKANAYGHGLERVVSALDDADGFAVATVDEGMRLRSLGIKTPVLVLTGMATAHEYVQANKYSLSLCIHNSEQLQLIESGKYQNKCPEIWLMLDTGMHRLGFLPEEVPAAIKSLGSRCQVMMTHFSDADDPAKNKTSQQLALFNELTAGHSQLKSVANSAAILSREDSYLDWVRPGIMLYGSSPLKGKSAASLGLKPVMTATAPLIAKSKIRAGERVGYGGEYICEQDMLIGVIAAGYGDGYPRHARADTPVLINGKLCPLAGRVSMDMLTVDLRNNKTAKVGDEVILWGEGLSVDTIAEHSETIGYELLCSAGKIL